MKSMIFARDNAAIETLLKFVLWTFCSAACFGQSQPTNGTNLGNSSDYVCVQRGPYSKVWQQTLIYTNTSGSVETNEQSFEELSTGISYLSNGVYVDSVEEVDSATGGAQAIQGRHQVQWSANANTSGGAVIVTTPDLKQLASTVYGLAYYDTATGSNAGIGHVKNCNGSIVEPNQVLYADAFSNVTADILYTYTKAGLSQDIVLRQAPLAPDTYGLSDDSTLLQIYTQFFDSPTPEVAAVTNGNVVDDQLDFGDMKMGPGEALFLNGQEAPVAAGLVTKEWVEVNGGTYLVESIPYAAISDALQQLPQASNLRPGKSIRRLSLLEPNQSKHGKSAIDQKPMKIAKADTTKPRLVIDYVLLSSSTNLTLQGDTTYLVTGVVNVTGTTTIEGGTVVKFTNNGTANITTTNIVCQTAAYSPGVFTSLNDNSVGSVITGSTGTPAPSSISFLNFSTLGANSLLLKNLRFSYASNAIYGSINSLGANSVEIWDCQFVNCAVPFWASSVSYTGSGGFPIAVYNVLFTVCSNGVGGSDVGSSYLSINAVNVTADQIGTFVAGGGSNTCNATNSIFTGSGASGIVLSGGNCYTNTTNTGIYQVVGAGSYYLAAGSPYRDSGTSSINPAVLAELQNLTTYPPMVMPTSLTNDYTFFPQVQRDTDVPDIGYHYAPIDYAVNAAVANANLTVLPGTVMAEYGGFGPGGGGNPGYGIYLYSNATLNCTGTPTYPDYFIENNTVQEQSNTNWIPLYSYAVFVDPTGNNSSASFTFTDWSVLTSFTQFGGDGGASAPISFVNCQFYGGSTGQSVSSVTTASNCLFRRVNMSINDSGLGNVPETFYNNLFLEGELTVNHANSGTYAFRDNLFDQTVISSGLTVINICSNNAYVKPSGVLSGVLSPENNDITLSNSPAYQIGALGINYYPTNLSLIHAGSESAPAAGLYHYTVTTNNAVEGTNTVSIGFHYVAVGSNGLPLDTNGDGIPDYLEDANGNGVVDSGEINWLVAGDLGLTVIITRPSGNSSIP
jgi:hypothetical protein